jgi:hypothetical protein
MASVRHFTTNVSEFAACGVRVFLCEDYTDEKQYVDCARCKRTKVFATYDPTRYDVDVWNHEGDVIRWFRRVTAAEVDGIREEYSDNPTASIVITEVHQ